ncbi:immunoglobulin domain-containing protein [Horticoccus luteus]|uniref:Immunoglobulin domain-containing protein n=1 Tax=Horticoccus luteus TaxID=2862869 RepID=A0A8F9TTJ9_9BACT|nr:immunoglobulin domain-containing protein [Horticoccus luteus]QYM77870.1 immunoglobulin domain-containing protein [Horticoccus luteus]
MLPPSLLRLARAAAPLRAIALLTGLAGLAAAVHATPLNWAGTGYSLSPAANWTEATAPSASSDLVITKNGTTSGGSGTSNFLMGGNLTIRSITFNNASAQFNASNGARVITTNSSSSSASYTLSFATPGVDIITLTNNTNASFRSASLSGNSSADPQPALSIDLNYSGTANLNIQDTSILLVSAGSYNTTEARLSGTGGLVKIGTGSLTLSGNHTYAGGFTLQDGTVTVTTSGTVTANTITNSPFGTGALTIRGGTLIASSNTSRSVYGSVNLDGVATITSTSNGTAGNYTISSLANGATTLLSNSTIVVPGPAYDTANATNVGGQVTWNQAISGDFSLTKMGAGTLVLNTNSPFAGGLAVKEGLLRVDSTANLGKLPSTENPDAVVFDGGSFEVTGSSFSSPNRGFRIAPATSFTVDDGISLRIQGSIRDVAGKSGRLIKAGPGVLALEPAAGMVYTYSGGTQVDAGTLQLMAATLGASGSPGVTFADGTSLEGNGTLVGDVVLSATTRVSPATYGDINPPNNTLGVTGVGTITVNGNLALSAVAATPGSLAFDLDAPGTNDALAVTGGTLSLGNAVFGWPSFAFTTTGSFAEGRYTLLTSDSPMTGSLAASVTGDIGTLKGTVLLSHDRTKLFLVVDTAGSFAGPDITTQPASLGVVVGSPVTLTVAANGSQLTYQWKKDGVDLPGETKATLSLAAAGFGDAGDYVVTVANTAESLVSQSATLAVTAAMVAPSITTNPVATSANIGHSVTFSVSASGTAPFTYQWSKDGVAIAGATEATFTIASPTASDAGGYTVAVTNASGTAISAAGTLTINPGAYLSNLSVRAAMNEGQTLIVGFVIAGGAKPILVRAAGPALNAFGLTGLPDPRLALYDEHSTNVGANDDWDGALAPLFSQLGAFGFAPGSKDAALQQTINGPHTAQATGLGNGTILVEGYDAGANDGRKLVNLSARYHVGTGADVLIVGFVVNGSGTKDVLIRAVGPTLASFGVTGTLGDPKLDVYDDAGHVVASNDNWNANLAGISATLGAFPLNPASNDAAILVTVEAGKTYTAQISGVNNGTGEALVEVYDANP